MVFTVSFVLSSGSDALLPPSPFRMCDARTGWPFASPPRLDARTSGVGTTRLLRPRTSSPGSPRLACAHREDHAKTLSAPCRIARGPCSRFPALQAPIRADAVAATASRPASRDDRETPLVASGMARFVRQNRTSLNSNIFTADTRPTAGVFCPTGDTTDRGWDGPTPELGNLTSSFGGAGARASPFETTAARSPQGEAKRHLCPVKLQSRTPSSS